MDAVNSGEERGEGENVSPETKPKNGWGSIMALIGGLPIALCLGVIFGAGSMKARVDTLTECVAKEGATNDSQESRLIRLETIYTRTAEDIKEIKAMLRSNK